MRKCILYFMLSVCVFTTNAQFAPPAGQAGTTAMHKDSSAFVAWATGCTVVRGYQDISNTTLGYASVGDSSMALAMAGSNGVVSLGDGGYAIVTFDNPISNGPGFDFAIFENSFSDAFLELAFVEVSSDGMNYFRFPATSNTQDTLQIGSFGSVDATKINNLAGKYRAMFGTPFDLEELSSHSELNINAVTHIKIIDAVGCIQNAFASYDNYGHKVNDPWNTPFASSGFDLDAVGVINQAATGVLDIQKVTSIKVYPNPCKGTLYMDGNFDVLGEVTITNTTGQIVKLVSSSHIGYNYPIDVSSFSEGMYFVSISTQGQTTTKKLMIEYD